MVENRREGAWLRRSPAWGERWCQTYILSEHLGHWLVGYRFHSPRKCFARHSKYDTRHLQADSRTSRGCLHCWKMNGDVLISSVCRDPVGLVCTCQKSNTCLDLSPPPSQHKTGRGSGPFQRSWILFFPLYSGETGKYIFMSQSWNHDPNQPHHDWTASESSGILRAVSVCRSV